MHLSELRKVKSFTVKSFTGRKRRTSSWIIWPSRLLLHCLPPAQAPCRNPQQHLWVAPETHHWSSVLYPRIIWGPWWGSEAVHSLSKHMVRTTVLATLLNSGYESHQILVCPWEEKTQQICSEQHLDRTGTGWVPQGLRSHGHWQVAQQWHHKVEKMKPLTSQKIDGAPQRAHEELRPRDPPTGSAPSPEHTRPSPVVFIQPVSRQMTSPRYRALH